MRFCNRVGGRERGSGLMGVDVFLVEGSYVGFERQYVFVGWVVFVFA